MSTPTNVSFRLHDEINKARIASREVSTINIEELLRVATNGQPQYLEGNTIETISKTVYDTLVNRVPNTHLQLIYEKLIGFRFVDEVYLLHRGKYVRWIRNDSISNKLEIGGIVVDIKITDCGVNVLCKLGARFTQYKFNECLTYQKLSQDEMLILAAYTAAIKPENQHVSK